VETRGGLGRSPTTDEWIQAPGGRFQRGFTGNS